MVRDPKYYGAIDYRQIASWGFNVVKWMPWWGKIEVSRDQPGVYDENLLKRMDDFVTGAGEAGLNVIINVQPCYDPFEMPYWAGWAAHDDLLDFLMLERYGKLWDMLISRYDKYGNVVGYSPLMFPWHTQPDLDGSREYAYNYGVMPFLASRLRSKTNKIVFLSSFHCDPKKFANMPPVTDRNVVYWHAFYEPWKVMVDGEPWDYNVDYQRSVLSSPVKFRDTHNVPLMISEFGLDIWLESPERPIRWDRLDLLRAKLDLLSEYGYNWQYWEYGIPDGCPMACLNKDYSVTPVVPILMEHAPPTPILPVDLPLIAAGSLAIADTALIGYYLAKIFGYA